CRLSRIRLAKSPYKKHLEDLDIDHLPENARNKLAALKSLQFIENKQTVILMIP
ncbi:MAG TPA: AAA family ATPase, partial [Candidatus Marinimicrobia bacterium]|nr:AAA family ATPase [Candidatus Neomarinimicrobiota bacterium]